ncbi:hypothetical protein BDR05DRAFT_946378 [Suillus weaverae]|nr:hypothetical protein BDR05DRAFT_946378 [Suillus weaverae]
MSLPLCVPWPWEGLDIAEVATLTAVTKTELHWPPPNPSSCVIIIQNNYIAEGGTINILSSHCNGSTVTKLDSVPLTAEPIPLNPPSARQAESAEHGRERIVLSGNTFGECVMINVRSPGCTGVVKKLLLHPELTATFRGRSLLVL